MAEDVARALGAGSGKTVTIAGKSCKVRPLNLGELAELQRICAIRWKKQKLNEFAKMILPGEDRDALIRDKRQQLSELDAEDLPMREVYSCAGTPATTQLVQFLQNMFPHLAPDVLEPGPKLDRIAEACLDQNRMSPEQYKKLTNGRDASVVASPYAAWWVGGTMEGMLESCWLCFQHSGVTRDELFEELSSTPGRLSEISKEIEHMSAPESGNG